MNRRSFLKGILSAGAFPLMSGCFSPRKYAANEKVRMAAIGVGCQAWDDIRSFRRHSDLCEFVALCDTDIGAKHTLPALKAYPNLPRYQDFRKMFDEMADRIDAVLIAIPDHAHFCAAMHAMRLGKAVYVEKPLAHSFRECELLMAAERKYGVVCQMGNQGHSGDNFFQYRHYFEEGLLGDVTKVVSHMNNERRWHRWGGKVFSFPKKEEVPATLDWNDWLSSVREHDYSHELTGGEWRCWYEFGNGCMGDWGAHIIDCVHQFTLGSALPTRVDIANSTGWNPFVFPIQNTLTFKFASDGSHGPVDLEWWEGLHNQPKPPKGFRYDSNQGLFPANAANDGMIEPKLAPGKEIYCADGRIWQGLSHAAPLKLVGGQDTPPYPKAYEDHYRNFLRAVRGECEPNSPFEVSAPLSELFCLGVVAQRLDRGFDFDPKARKVVGDDEVQSLLDGPAPRKGWESYYA